MNIRINIFIFFICIFSIFFSCDIQREDPEETLVMAEELVEQNPADALELLDRMVSPQTFSERTYHKYILLNTQARDKNDKDISRDTLIFKTRDYYVANNEMDNAALASFYAGRVLQALGEANNEEAMTYLKDAETYAKNNKDFNLKGLIQYDLGELMLKQISNEKPLSRFKQAIQYFDKAGAYENAIVSYNQIGRTFYLNKESDSAIFYYDKALALAKQHNNTHEQAIVKLNMGFAFMNAGEKHRARDYFRDALPYCSAKDDSIKTYTNIAYTFDAEKGKDSIIYYVNTARTLLKNDEKPALMASIYKLLSFVEEKNKNYPQAMAYQREYIRELNNFFQEKRTQEILDIQNKYDYAVIKSDNDRLIIEKQWWYLIALSLFVVVLLTSFAFYRYRVKNRERLLDAQQKILQLRDLANSYDEKELSVKNVLIQHLDILKKAALVEGYLKDEEKKQGEKLLKKFNEIVYGQDSVDWSKLFQTINHLSNNFADKVAKQFPQLEDIEFKICCLTEADFSNMEISIILGLSVNTVQMKKSNIRKKLGLAGYGNIVEYLKENIS